MNLIIQALLMPLFIFLFIFISTWTYGKSEECLSILREETSPKDKLIEIANLKDSWNCVEHFYQETSQYTPNVPYNDVGQRMILGSVREYSHHEIISRISQIAQFYSSGNQQQNISPPSFLTGPKRFLLLGEARAYGLTFFSQKIPSIFNGFPMDMKNLFEFFAARNRILLNPYVNLHSNSSILLHSSNMHYTAQKPENLSLYTTENSISLSPVATCQESKNDSNTELYQYFHGLTKYIINFIENNSQVLQLYLSALNFYYLSHGKQPTLFIDAHDILRSMPYGFEISDSIKKTFTDPNDEQEALLEKLDRLVSFLKLYTFTEIMLLALFDCSPYLLYEKITVSRVNKIPNKEQSIDLWNSDTPVSNDSWTPYIDINYEVKEVFVFDQNFNPPKKHIAYDTLLFPEGFLTENDLLEDLCDHCFQSLENLHEKITGASHP